MKRSELLKLYKTEITTDPRTGRSKRISRYVGKHYRIDPALHRKAIMTLWISAAAALAVFLLGGLTNSRGSHCLYVLPQFALCLLPIWYMILTAFRLTRMKDVITEVDKVDGLEFGQGASTALLILGALWLLGETVFLITGGAAQTLALDLLFLGCSLITTAAGWFSRQALHRIRPEETAE